MVEARIPISCLGSTTRDPPPHLQGLGWGLDLPRWEGCSTTHHCSPIRHRSRASKDYGSHHPCLALCSKPGQLESRFLCHLLLESTRAFECRNTIADLGSCFHHRCRSGCWTPPCLPHMKQLKVGPFLSHHVPGSMCCFPSHSTRHRWNRPILPRSRPCLWKYPESSPLSHGWMEGVPLISQPVAKPEKGGTRASISSTPTFHPHT